MSGILFAITPQISIILHCNFHKTMFTKIDLKNMYTRSLADQKLICDICSMMMECLKVPNFQSEIDII